MFRIIAILLVSVVFTTAEPRVQQSRGLALNHHSANANNPYLFLSVPRGRSSAVVHGFEILDADASKLIRTKSNDDIDENLENEDDDDEGDYDISHRSNEQENDDEEEEEQLNYADKENFPNLKSILKNVKSTQMAVAKEHAGAIMVPDGVIEIEGQSVIDEKTGQEALLVPRSALNAIPDGSVVALIETSSLDEPVEEERANRVYVRRRRKGARKNIRRGFNKRRRNGNKNRRLSAKRKNVRVIRTGGKNRRRRVNNSIRPIRIQG